MEYDLNHKMKLTLFFYLTACAMGQRRPLGRKLLANNLNCDEHGAGDPFRVKMCLIEKQQNQCLFNPDQCSDTKCDFGFLLDENQVNKPSDRDGGLRILKSWR